MVLAAYITRDLLRLFNAHEVAWITRKDAAVTGNVLEIRNYRLKPAVLEHFIDYFEAHFIASQEAEQMQVLGQFRLIGEPNRFVWMRGFSDMAARQAGLSHFYNGAVWQKYGPRANEMMLEWHQVHLLRPLDTTLNLMGGMNAETIAAELADGTISPATGLIALEFYQARPGQGADLIEVFQTQLRGIYQQAAIQLRGLFTAEMSANTYPALPVIQQEDLLVVITAYADEADYATKHASVAAFHATTPTELLSAPPEILLLSPTLRSPLRYVPRS